MENSNAEFVSRNERKYLMIALLAAGIGLLAVALLAQNGSATTYTWPTGHTIAGTTETYNGDFIDCTGDLVIKSDGKMIMKNTTLNMSVGSSVFVDGIFEVHDKDSNNATTSDRSVIQPLSGSMNFKIVVNANANLLIEYSLLQKYDTIYLYNTNSTIRYNVLRDSVNGVSMSSDTKANINNNSFLNDQRALSASTNAKVTFIRNYVKGCYGIGGLSFSDANVYMQDNIIESGLGPQISFAGNGRTLDMNNDTVRSTVGGGDNVRVANGGPLADYIYVDDCNISKAQQIGLDLFGAPGLIKGYINDSKFLQNNAHGIYARNTNLTINNIQEISNYYGIYSLYSTIKMSDSTIQKSTQGGIYFLGTDPSSGNVLTFSKVKIKDNVGMGLEDRNTLGLQIDNSTINNNTQQGIYLNTLRYTNIYNSAVTNSTGNHGIGGANVNYVNISKSDISHNKWSGIILNTCDHVKITDNTIVSNGAGSNSVETRTSSVVLRKNTITGGWDGYFSALNNNNHYIDVDQNTIKGAGLYAININSGHVNITKNIILNSANTQVIVQYLFSGSRIDDNDIRNGGNVGLYVLSSEVVSISGNTIINHTHEHAIAISDLGVELHFVKNKIDKSAYGMSYYDGSDNEFGIVFNNNTISNTTDNWAVYSQFYSYNGNASFQDNKFYDNYLGLYFDHYDGLRSMYIRRNTFSNTTNNWAFMWYNEYYYAGYLDVSNNKVNKCSSGIYVSNMGKIDIRKNIITNNNGNGMEFDGITGPMNITDNIGHNNINGEAVIYTQVDGNYYQYPANIQRNNLSDNPDSYALEFYGFSKILLEDNILNNNYYGAEYDGVSLIARNNQYINNSQYGSYAYEFIDDMHYYNETVKNNRDHGMYICEIYNGAHIIIDNSTFKDNRYGLYFEDFYDGSTIDVENSTIDGGQDPMGMENIYGEVRIHDNLIANSSQTGLEYDNIETSMVYVYNNHFLMNNEHLYPYWSNTVIERNVFERGRYGIDAQGRHQLFILRNNTFKGIGGDNVEFYYANPTAGSGIYDNHFLNFGTGLYFEDYGNDLPVFRNDFAQGQTGIELYGIKPAIHDNTFRMLSEGIYSSGSYATIRSNSFKNCWNYCIYSEEDKGIIIVDNDFSYSSVGVYVESSLVTLDGNTFSLNTYGARIYSSFGTATGNKFTDNKYGLYIESYSFVNIVDGYYSDNTEFGIWSEVNTYSTLEVTGTTTVLNDNILLNGEATIKTGGTLQLTGSKIMIRSVGSSGYSLIVEAGGSLVASKTTFQPENASRPYGIQAQAHSSLDLNDCDVIGLGSGTGTSSAIYIATSDVVLENVRITGSPDVALYIEGKVTLAMRNGTISGSKGYDVFIQNASVLRMGNTDFKMKNVKVLDTSEIIIERIISVTALDDADMPYSGVGVTVTDDQSNVIQGTTDADGLWFRFFEGAIISSSGTTDTKITYTISVSDGTQTFNDTVRLSDDFVKTYRFGKAPVVLNGPKEIVTDEDTVFDIDLTKYFFDNDQTIFSTVGNVSTMYSFDGYMAHLIPAKDWNGHEDVTLVATDTHGLKAQYQISVTVRPVNDPPVISGVPNLVLKEDQEFKLDLTSFIYDPDTPQSGLTVTVDTQYAKVDRTTVTFKYPMPMIQWVRITVKDGQGGSSQDILVTVSEVNDPPQIKGIPVQEAIERVELTVDFLPWLSDEDNNVSTLTMSSTSPFVIGANGTKLTFLFPDGPTQRFVSVMVSDGQANSTYLVEFFVTPVNDAPKLAPLPAITVTEDQDYVFDLTPYVSDVDTNISKLILTTNSSYIRIDGLNLIIHIPDSGPMMTVTVTVSDSFLSASRPLRIVIIPVNDAPTLLTPKGPKDGTQGSDFKFQVTFKDPDAVNPAVFVVVDGKKYVMTKVSGDFKNGALYEINLKNVLSAGGHNYHFEADDGSGESNGQARTEETFGLDVAQQQSLWWVMILIIVIIIVVAVVLLMMKGKSGPDEVKMDEETEAEEEEKKADKDEEEEEAADKDEEDEEAPEEEPEEAEEVEEEPEEAEDEPEEPPRKKKAAKGR